MSIYTEFMNDPFHCVADYATNFFYLLPAHTPPPVINTFSLDEEMYTYNHRTIQNIYFRVAAPGSTPLQAHFLPYLSTGVGVAMVTFDASAPGHDFLFTGGLTGCSVIVTRPDPKVPLLNVYHQPPTNPSIAKGPVYNGETVLAWYHPSDYLLKSDPVACGTAFLYRNTLGIWYMVGQSLWIGEPYKSYEQRGTPYIQWIYDPAVG
ncbi:hypothetical protein [Oscillibacter sp. GMB15532]|uniref:hypothetical protein n=1 Tax=Oscillibacter sp. GMB15532 TaxID=3230022 RepID=UPI0034DE0C5D